MTHAWIAATQNWCPWCGDHMGWGGWTMMIGWLLILILVVIGAIWAFGRRGMWSGDAPQTRDRAEETLRERFARGEIDEETYRRKLDELRRR